MTSFDTTMTSKEGPTIASIDSGPVQAYAKLEGDDFCYYIRTLQISLGRKVSVDSVDVPLGNTKSVSRQHARLFYNFATQRFELLVLGKNGAFVNERFIEKSVTVPLENRTKIQIGEKTFLFLLPGSEGDKVSNKNTVSMEDVAYISTPQQLEKKMTNSSPLLQPTPLVDMPLEESDPVDDESETEANIYHSKDIKPPYSYASLIAQAINSTESKKMTLNGIYKYITTNFSYYKLIQNGWQNSIRHNLSLNKAFVKVPRNNLEPGKGAFWKIVPDAEIQFSKNSQKKCKRTFEDEPFKKKPKHETNEQHISDPHNPSILHSSITQKTHEDEDDEVNEEDEDENENEVENKEEDEDKSPKKSKKKSKKVPLQEKTVTDEEQQAFQLQLQNTIRQHLLNPVQYPLPPSIAQLLPQAIAQLPVELASQLSSTLSTALKMGNTNVSNTIIEAFNVGTEEKEN